MDAVSADLLTGFLAEAHGYVTALRQDLTRSIQVPDRELLRSMAERMGILAGSVEMLGLEKMARLADPATQILAALAESGDSLSEADCALLAATLDQIERDLDQRVAPASPPGESKARSLLPANLPAELLDIFSLEAHEHNQAIQSGLEYLSTHPDDKDALSEFRRVAHTLKGAAASIGFSQMAHLAHLMEEIIERFIENNTPLSAPVLELLLDSADVLDALIQPEDGKELPSSFEMIEQRYVELLGEAISPPPEPETSSEVTPETQDTPLRVANRTDNMLRLPLTSMDLLINRTGEIIINRSALERLLGSMRGLLDELDLSNKRLRQVTQNINTHIEITLPVNMQVRQGDDTIFDPLELDRYSLLYQFARELEEIAADAGDTGSQIGFLYDDLSAGLIYERRLTTDLQDSLMATRLVSFYEMETRVRRTIHRTARDLGKEVEVVLSGFETKVDKTILDTLADPLMHLLRNAIGHGIELPAARQANHKPTTGVVRLAVARERGRIMLTLSDDGAGIDLKQVQQRAIELGLLSAGDHPGPQKLYMLLFEEGFSLAKTVTHTSGRGVGLDIVRRAINRLQGTIRVDSTPCLGTTFVLSVPVTLAITQALFITSHNQRFAIPLEQINAVLRLPLEVLDEFNTQGIIHYDGQPRAAYDLAQFVRGTPAPTQMARYGLVVETGDQSMIVLVEGLVGIREAVVKSLGAHLRRVPGVVGATIAGDGSVTLILDLLEIVGIEERGYATDDAISAPPSFTAATENPHVLVVDDSPSVRRVVCSFLERIGWQATDAKDGIDALEKIASVHPDVALIDIEMPRMNGYELLSRIKSDPGLQHIPVVFLTSRAAAKHRERAAQLHVDGYLVKPYRESDLIEELLRVMAK